MLKTKDSSLDGSEAGVGVPTVYSDDPEPAAAAFGLNALESLNQGQKMRLQGPRKRFLGYRLIGAPLGPAAPGRRVALYFHGIPSCAMEAAALEEAAQELDVTIVAFDRPGIGDSTYHRSSSLQSVAQDAKQLLERLGVERVAVIGTSGGGPYAAAFAQLYPGATVSLTLVCPLGPSDRRHKQLRATLQGFDYAMMRLAPMRLGLVWLMHRVMKYMAYSHPKTLLKYAPEGMAAVDGALLSNDPRVKEAFQQCLQHAYQRGAKGMAHDALVLASRWRFDPAQIQCRTQVWQGLEDETVPLPHAKFYSTTIPGAALRVQEGEGHVTLLVHHAKGILGGAVGATTEASDSAASLTAVTLEPVVPAAAPQAAAPETTAPAAAAGQQGVESGGAATVGAAAAPAAAKGGKAPLRHGRFFFKKVAAQG